MECRLLLIPLNNTLGIEDGAQVSVYVPLFWVSKDRILKHRRQSRRR